MRTTALLVVAITASPAVAQEATTRVHTCPIGYRLTVPADWVRSAGRWGTEFHERGQPSSEPPVLSIQTFARPSAPGVAGTAEGLADFFRKIATGTPYTVLGEEAVTIAGRSVRAVRWRDGVIDRTAWSLGMTVSSQWDVVLTFRARPAGFQDRIGLFRRVAATLEPYEPLAPAPGHLLARHETGLSFEVPAGWSRTLQGNRECFAPPGDAGATWPLVVVVTAPAPGDLSTLDAVEGVVVRDLAGVALRVDRAATIGGATAREFRWTDADGVETVQVVAIWHGALIAITTAVPPGADASLRDALRHARNGLRLD